MQYVAFLVIVQLDEVTNLSAPLVDAEVVFAGLVPREELPLVPVGEGWPDVLVDLFQFVFFLGVHPSTPRS